MVPWRSDPNEMRRTQVDTYTWRTKANRGRTGSTTWKEIVYQLLTKQPRVTNNETPANF